MITVPYRGIIEIVGGHDVGKTIAALQTAYPYDKVVFVDDDMKGDGTVRQMNDGGIKFGKYINLGERRVKLGNVPTADDILKQVVFPTIEEITKTRHEVIIWDTWRVVYSAARAHVERNQTLYKDVVNFRGTNEIVQGLISKVARGIEQAQLNKLRAACDLLIITHHLKDKYVKNVIVGEAPESSTTFSEVCNMRLWLRRNPNSKVPIILFLKRPNMPKVIEGNLEFVNIVPMKVTPKSSDKSIWEAIKRYEIDPIESRQPVEDETPTSEEYAVISNTLSTEQKAYVMEIIKYQKDDLSQAQNIASVLTADTPPSTGVLLLTRAMAEFDLNGDALEKETGVSTADLMTASPERVSEIWEALKTARKI